MFDKYRVFDIDKENVSYDKFLTDLLRRKEEGFDFHVGADSQTYSTYIIFVTTICYHHRTKGAAAYYIKQRFPREKFPSLRARMQKELFLALEAAVALQELLILSSNGITVHLDIGTNPVKNRTHIFIKEFTNIVKGQGYNVKVKPDSWASSEVADWFTR